MASISSGVWVSAVALFVLSCSCLITRTCALWLGEQRGIIQQGVNAGHASKDDGKQTVDWRPGNSQQPQCSPSGVRDDCGYYGIQRDECISRGCCWAPTQQQQQQRRRGQRRQAAAEPLAASLAGDGSARPSGRGNDVPWCFFPNAGPEAAYVVESVNATACGGWVARLRLQAGSGGRPDLGPDFQVLEVVVEQHTRERLYVRIQPSADDPAGGGGGARWHVPETLLPRPPAPSSPPPDALYSVQAPAAGQPFALKVTRRTSGCGGCSSSTASGSSATAAAAGRPAGGGDSPAGGSGSGSIGGGGGNSNDNGGQQGGQAGEASAGVLLDVGGGGALVFKPQFIQMRMAVAASADLYGLGEMTQPDGALRLPRDGRSVALFNSDTPASATGVNLYGSHPLLYVLEQPPAAAGSQGSRCSDSEGAGEGGGYVGGEEGGSSCCGGGAHGLFVANSNAMDVQLGPDAVTFMLTGGIVELFLFAGPSPEQVSQQYTQVVGAPAMPPRWALGFHQSRYGYRDVDELAAVADAYACARIPLEVVWSDIDYADRARMFTTDPDRYPKEKLAALIGRLHAAGQRWVPIVDCGMTALPGEDYPPYERGMAAGVFIRDASGQPALGEVWSGPTHWPDFLHPTAHDYWRGLLADMYAGLPFDGIWLDMNEPSNFCSGEVCRLPAASDAAAHRAAATAPAANWSGIAAARSNGNSGSRGGGASSNSGRRRRARRMQDEGAMSTGSAASRAAGYAGGGGGSGGGAEAYYGSSSSGGSGGGLDGFRSRLDLRRTQPRQAGDGTIGSNNMGCSLECTAPGPDDPLSYPPYRVNNGNRHAPLWTNTLPMSARGAAAAASGAAGGAAAAAAGGDAAARAHGNGSMAKEGVGALQYDAHNLYALAEARATHAALADITGRRPFILTRSSWAGMGRYAAHWTGDNAADWPNLRASVAGLLASNLAGMALAGADVCGFFGDTNEELCARWLSASAFYTFMRDHSFFGSLPQEAYRWPATAQAARKALGLRYSLLPYLYTAFYKAHTQGGTVARPLTWQFPDDPRVRANVRQWLLGDALMAAPVLEQGAVSVRAYLPAGIWCSAWDYGDCRAGPADAELPAPLDHVPVLLRAGHIVPLHASPGMTTSETATSPLSLLVLLASKAAPGRQRSGGRPAKGSGSDEGIVVASDVGVTRGSVHAQRSAAARQEAVSEAWNNAWEQHASGQLYADDGESLQVGGAGSLWARMEAVANLSSMSGRLRYSPQQAPAPGAARNSATAATAGPAHQEDPIGIHAVEQLVVDRVVVVGAVLLPGAVVEVQVDGEPVPAQQVSYDSLRQMLNVSGLGLSAVRPFKLAWASLPLS